jgi:hypothetical protein
VTEATELARATAPDELLGDVSWLLLGGCYFELSKLEWDRAAETIRLPLTCRDKTLTHRRPEALVVREVLSVRIEDEARVDDYELRPIEYEPSRGVVEIGGFPSLLIEADVRRLDVRVVGSDAIGFGREG